MARWLLLLLAGFPLFAQPLDRPIVVLLIGPPASGKTTQADYLHQKYRIPVITVEKLILGEDGQPLMERGDSRVNGFVRRELLAADTSRGFVIDGYPATRAQADFLASMLRELTLPRPLIVQLQVPDEVARQRSRERDGPEDSPRVVERRLAEYHREMEMVRGYYPEADIWTVDATRPVSGVSQTIRLLVEDR